MSELTKEQDSWWRGIVLAAKDFPDKRQELENSLILAIDTELKRLEEENDDLKEQIGLVDWKSVADLRAEERDALRVQIRTVAEGFIELSLALKRFGAVLRNEEVPTTIYTPEQETKVRKAVEVVSTFQEEDKK